MNARVSYTIISQETENLSCQFLLFEEKTFEKLQFSSITEHTPGTVSRVNRIFHKLSMKFVYKTFSGDVKVI